MPKSIVIMVPQSSLMCLCIKDELLWYQQDKDQKNDPLLTKLSFSIL